ncbi:MAG TPA: HAD-IA family hydrolase [Acidimicrobiales bacterium]|nr:HAD-IA family hydrolase [Acidimicrobiales bacterium]
MIRAVVFDFDGLILETEGPWMRAWMHVFEHFGVEVDELELIAGVGTHFDAYEVLVARATTPLPSEREVRDMWRARGGELSAHLPVLPGVEQWLADAAGAGLPIAIASSSQETSVAPHLERHNLRGYFSHLACWVEGVAPKPAPDLYLIACAALGVSPADALAIEDSANGVAAAKAAGMWCVAVPNQLTRQLDLSAADVQLDSLAHATLADVIATIRERA